LAFNFRLQQMRLNRAFMTGASLGVCAVAHAVYAPIPDQEQGKALSVSIESGISYNTNIFGSSTGDIASTVFEVSPKLSFNSSLTDDTFLSADVQPTLDYFDNRPGTKTLYSQEADAKLAHKFSGTSVGDISDQYSYNQNPEALLNGLQKNTDQTLQSNEFDTHFTFAPVEKMSLTVKARSVYYDYIEATLGDELNRFENLYGLEGDFDLQPNLKLAGEYRHQDVDYSTDPATKNKHTDFLMTGLDYDPGPKINFSFRVGGEYRHLDGFGTQTTPYAELSGKYLYQKDSFVSVGYTYSLEETSDPVHYIDEKVNRMFVNIQHSFTPMIVGSASLTYAPAELVGRPGNAGITEDTTNGGVALTYIPTKNWTVSATYDYDFVDSALSARGFGRSRYGVTATVVF
jgi:hypothetical protein